MTWIRWKSKEIERNQPLREGGIRRNPCFFLRHRGFARVSAGCRARDQVGPKGSRRWSVIAYYLDIFVRSFSSYDADSLFSNVPGGHGRTDGKVSWSLDIEKVSNKRTALGGRNSTLLSVIEIKYENRIGSLYSLLVIESSCNILCIKGILGQLKNASVTVNILIPGWSNEFKLFFFDLH